MGIRKAYMVKLCIRFGVLLLCGYLVFSGSPQPDILSGGFFERFSLLHLLWAVWMFNMACQLVPHKLGLSLGSKKLFGRYFVPSPNQPPPPDVAKRLMQQTKLAYNIFIVWALLTALLGMLHSLDILSDSALFLISVLFYLCDLICVLIWCPFRCYLRNQCCTTCRIFNWDHLMMFSPMLFVGSFFSWSLLLTAIMVWLCWECSVFIHPERFCKQSNEALKCSSCTDKLCTHRCSKQPSASAKQN